MDDIKDTDQFFDEIGIERPSATAKVYAGMVLVIKQGLDNIAESLEDGRDD